MREWPDPDLRRKLERRFVARALDVLDGRITLIAATQGLSKLAYQLGLRDGDPVVDALRLIASETDRLPVGPERSQWADAALARLAPEIDRAEVWAREFGLDTCRDIVARYSTKSS